MKYGGMSLIGSYHAQNQDNYAAREVTGGYVLAVSDGLGSKKHSQAGSAALCTAACDAASTFGCDIANEEEFINRLHGLWSDILHKSYLNIDDCRATALIGIIAAHKLCMFRLGDGFIGASFDDECLVMFDAKTDRFANESDCLGNAPDAHIWEVKRAEFEIFGGMVAGTDGLMLANDETILKKFIADFCRSYRNENLNDILTDVGQWLPKFKGIDDRTLAFVMTDGQTEAT